MSTRHETPDEGWPHIPDASIRLDSMPADGRALTVSVDDDLRTEIAEALDITSVDELKAELRAKRFRGGMRVEGRLRAKVTQPCVLTLEPVHQDIDEAVDRVFLPSNDRNKSRAPVEDLLVDVEGEDLPDLFDGREADLSDMIVETLALAIDPYPRAPGANLDGVSLIEDDEDPSPFAALTRLKEKGD